MDESLQVLMVEDSESDAKLIARHIERAGLKLHWERVENAAAITAALRRQEWDVILCDYSMPDFNGIDALNLIRAANCDSPFIFVSGTMGEDVAVEAMRKGAQDYLMKGNLRRLVPAMERELREAELRKQNRLAEQALALRTNALQATANAIAITSCDGSILWVNPAFTHLTGYSAEEVVARHTRLLKSGCHDESTYADLWNTVLAGRVWRGELINRRKDGSLYPEEMTITPVKDPHGKITHFVAVKQDITERKHAEETLCASESRFRDLYDNAPNAYFSIGADLRISRCNRRAGELLGRGVAELVGLPFVELFGGPSNERSRSEKMVQRVMEGETVNDEELQMLRADGSPLWISLTVSAIRDDQGRVVESRSIVVDITERKKTERELRWKTAFLEAQVDSSLDGILVVNAQGKKILQNNRLNELWKIPQHVAEDRNDAAQVEFVMNRTKDPQEFARKVEYLYSHPDELSLDEIELIDGTILDRYSSPVRDKAGRLYGRIWTFRDITRRKLADAKEKSLEAQLMQAQKLESLGTLASGIAHDFNNILGIIMGHASIIERRPGYSSNVEMSLAAINKASRRGADLVKQMLTFARKTDIAFDSVMLNDVVNDAAKLLLETFPKTITVDLHLLNGLPLVEADVTQAHQVLLNLCVNARDAMPDGGTLTITTEREPGEALRRKYPKATGPDYVVLSVTDTGVGMAEETQRRVFEPFFTTKERGKGTGLGLALVFGIMEGHGGFVSLQSELGRGTTLQCYFPVQSREHEPAPLEEMTDEGLTCGTETILVVEDEEMLRILLRTYLDSKGYRTLTAEDGEEALAIFKRHQNDIRLVLSDLGLPKFGGDELYGKLKQLNPDVLFILASGFIEPGLKSEILMNGVREFIPKPYSPKEVLRAIRRTIDKG